MYLAHYYAFISQKITNYKYFLALFTLKSASDKKSLRLICNIQITFSFKSEDHSESFEDNVESFMVIKQTFISLNKI